jgi:hypothetical protein
MNSTFCSFFLMFARKFQGVSTNQRPTTCQAVGDNGFATNWQLLESDSVSILLSIASARKTQILVL